MDASGIQVGGRYALKGVGVVEARETGDTFVLVDNSGDEYDLPRDSVAANLRPLVTRVEAEALLQRLMEPGAEALDRKEAPRVYRRAHRSGELAQMVEPLRSLLATTRSAPIDERYRELLTVAVYGELSAVLDVPVRTLKTRVTKATRAAQGREALKYLDAPDRSAEVAGYHARIGDNETGRSWVPIGTIYIEEAIVVGEMGAGITVKAKPGAWYVYSDFDEEEMDAEFMLAVHHEYGDESPYLPGEDVGVVPINGASMTVCDAWFAEDPEVRRALEMFEGPVIADRAATLNLGGDGSGKVRRSVVDGEAVFLEIALQ